MSKQEVFDRLKHRIEDDRDGTRRYYNAAGQYHRDDGPAVEYPGGSKYWYQNGLLHRTDGPAIEYTNGRKEWYQNGQRHRTDGPAVEDDKDWGSGYKAWFVNGKQLSRR